MSRHIGMIIDPIESLTASKDTSVAFMLEAQRRGWVIHYMTLPSLFIESGIAKASMQTLRVTDTACDWYTLAPPQTQPLHDLDVIFMRKDPPVDAAYLYATHILSLAESQGATVINRPQALRDFNEKIAITHFPDLTPNTLISQNQAQLKAFIQQQEKTVLKPLDGMGGLSIFQVSPNDPNLNVTLELLTHYGTQAITAQTFLPEITEHGDKRILMINGEPFPYALARIPKAGEIRGNLAAGGSAVGAELTVRDQAICRKIGGVLKEKGLVFVGIDVIGDYLTEINVTSPTCVRQIDAIFGVNVSGGVMDFVEGGLFCPLVVRQS